MSLFITEAAIVGAKEAVKLALVWLVLAAYLRGMGKEWLLRPFYAGVALASLITVLVFFLPPADWLRETLARLAGYVFFLSFLGSIAALYQSSGIGLFRGFAIPGPALRPGVLLLTAFYFAPDIAGTSLFVRELSIMKETALGVYLSAAAGFSLALAFGYAALRKAGRRIGPFFGTGQLLLFLAMVKLLGGGTKGYVELSLVPSVQRGVMKFVHDAVHQVFVMLLVPDHPMLTTTAWTFVGVFFGPNVGLAAALLLLVSPPLMFLYRSAVSPIPGPPGGAASGAERRRFRAAIRADRLRKAAPVAVFVIAVLLSWFAGRGKESLRLYNPQPKPVVEDKGAIVLPLTDPTMDLSDGRVHKFSVARGAEVVTFLVIKRPGGGLAVCLDACEICPPEGYGQGEGDLVCLYCMTPIPLDTVGRPGGCNPIPLEAAIMEKEIRIEAAELDRKWRFVKSGESKEGLR